MDWLSGPASIVSSLIGGLFGNHQQKKANEANIQMVRETNQANIEQQQLANASNQLIAKNANELQLQMMRDAQRWNQEQLTAERAYNSPLQQVHRLLQAGINPSSASADTQAGFSGSPMGTAQVGAPMQAAQLQAPQVQPITSMSQHLGDIAGVLGALSVSKMQTDTQRYGIEAEASARAVGNQLTKRGQDIQRDLQEKQLKINSNKANAEVALSQSLADQANATVDKLQSESRYQNLVNSYLPRQIESQLHLNSSQADAAVTNAAAFLQNVQNQYDLGIKSNTLDKREFLHKVVEDGRRYYMDLESHNIDYEKSEKVLQLLEQEIGFNAVNIAKKLGMSFSDLFGAGILSKMFNK